MPLSPTSFGQINGNDPTLGSGAHGKGGRMPNTMRDRLRIIAERSETVAQIEKVLGDSQHRHFKGVLDTVMDHGYGKAPQSIDLTSNGQPIPGVVILPPTEAQALPQPTPTPQLPQGNVAGGGGTPDQVGG